MIPIMFNSIHDVAQRGHGLVAGRFGTTAPCQAGLSISPLEVRARRSDPRIALTLIVIGLGFLAATALFILALMAVALA